MVPARQEGFGAMAGIAGGTRRPVRFDNGRHIATARFWINSVGKIHRSNGPAFEGDNGSKGWYKDGEPYMSESVGHDGRTVGYKWYDVRSKE